MVKLDGAGRGNRTPMELLPTDFESAASASSAIPALQINSRNERLFQTVSAAFRQYRSQQRAFNSAQTSGLIFLPVSHSPCLSTLSVDILASPIGPEPRRAANAARISIHCWQNWRRRLPAKHIRLQLFRKLPIDMLYPRNPAANHNHIRVKNVD